MTHPDDSPADDAGRFLDVPRFATDLDSVMLRDFVRVAIDEGLVIPLAVTPDRVVILLPDVVPGGDRTPPRP